MTRWKWTVLSDGWTPAREALLVRGGSWSKTVRCAVTAVLLEHEVHGPVLFDCGYSSRFFIETSRWPFLFYRALTPAVVTEAEGIAGILRRRQIDPATIKHVIISHWHADHVGGLRDFPAATVHADRRGWEKVKGLGGWEALRQAVLPGLIPEDIEERLRDLREGTDLFGDGSLVSLSLPGHATGQIGVRFVAPDGQPVLLAADSCYLSTSYRENRPPHPLINFLHDVKSYRETLDRLHRLSKEEPDLLIVPSHCPETAARIANEC